MTEPIIAGTGAYPNTYWFGKFITSYRDAHGFTHDQINEAGGPSRGTQAPIDKGSGVTVTQDTIDKLIHAYTKLVPEDHLYNVTMLKAATTILRTPVPDPARLSHLRHTADDWSNENQILLGIKVGSMEKLQGHGVALIENYHHPFEYSADARSDFANYIATIAMRQPSMVLIPATHEEALGAGIGKRAWDDIKPHGEQGSFGQRNKWPHNIAFDPISAITDLQEALKRAEALGAQGDEAFHLALVFIAANQAAAEKMVQTPIEALDNLFDRKHHVADRLHNIYKHLDIDPDINEVKALARAVLSPWRNEYIMSRQLISLDPTGTGLSFRTRPPNAPFNASRSESLWHYDETRFPLLPQVLASQHTPSLVLTPTSARLYGHGPCDLLYDWVPASGSHRCLLRDHSTNRWVAADIPDNYIRSKKRNDDR